MITLYTIELENTCPGGADPDDYLTERRVFLRRLGRTIYGLYADSESRWESCSRQCRRRRRCLHIGPDDPAADSTSWETRQAMRHHNLPLCLAETADEHNRHHMLCDVLKVLGWGDHRWAR